MSPYCILIVVVDCILLASNTLQFSHGFCRGLSQSPAPQRCVASGRPQTFEPPRCDALLKDPMTPMEAWKTTTTYEKKWSTLKHRLKTCNKSEKSGSEKVAAADSACMTYNQKLSDHYVLQNAIWLKNLRSYLRNVREFC